MKMKKSEVRKMIKEELLKEGRALKLKSKDKNFELNITEDAVWFEYSGADEEWELYDVQLKELMDFMASPAMKKAWNAWNEG